MYTHTHTHTRLTALCPGLPGWAGTRKVKPIWIILKQETASGSGISWAICKSTPHSRQVTTPAPHHSVFYRSDALPATQPTASQHWRQHWRRQLPSVLVASALCNMYNSFSLQISNILFSWMATSGVLCTRSQSECARKSHRCMMTYFSKKLLPFSYSFSRQFDSLQCRVDVICSFLLHYCFCCLKVLGYAWLPVTSDMLSVVMDPDLFLTLALYKSLTCKLFCLPTKSQTRNSS